MSIHQTRDEQPEGQRKQGRRHQRRDDTRGNRQSSAQGVSPDTWDTGEFRVEPKEGHVRFHDLDLPVAVLHAVADLNFRYCTPIQAEILPEAIKGVDAFGQAQTGTGKTAAFLIAILTQLMRTSQKTTYNVGEPAVLILAPTRELAIQIEKEAKALSKYCPITTLAIVGGIGYDHQLATLRNNIVDIVVATPGRLLDFKSKSAIHLKKVAILVIDEADRMLDMGFIPDVRRIINSTPPKNRRHTMMFSATLTADVTRLAASWTNDPIRVEIDPEQVAVDTVEQIVYITTAHMKFRILENLIQKGEISSALIFCNRRDQTYRLYRRLRNAGVNCGLISGSVDQKKRLQVLENFKTGQIRFLVATDVAGRGLHIEGISHVINYTLPYEPDDYVHRIGRTGRAGASGKSISFACEEDSFVIPEIEEFTGLELKCMQPPPELLKNQRTQRQQRRKD